MPPSGRERTRPRSACQKARHGAPRPSDSSGAVPARTTAVNPWVLVRRLPVPTNVLAELFFVLLPISFVAIVVGSPRLVGAVFAAVGVVAALLGTCLLTNLNNSAGEYASVVRETRLFGVDYSGSVFAKPGFIRVLGATFVLFGSVFVASGLAQAT